AIAPKASSSRARRPRTPAGCRGGEFCAARARHRLSRISPAPRQNADAVSERIREIPGLSEQNCACEEQTSPYIQAKNWIADRWCAAARQPWGGTEAGCDEHDLHQLQQQRSTGG